MSIVSDSAGVDEAKDPDKSVIFSIYKLFLNETDIKTLRTQFETPGLRYGDVKKELFSTIMDYFAPYRKREKSSWLIVIMWKRYLRKEALKLRSSYSSN